MKKAHRRPKRRTVLSAKLRLVLLNILLALSLALFLMQAKPAHADEYSGAGQPSQIICPEGYKLANVSADFSEPVIIGDGIWLTYPATTGGVTCVKVRS